MFLRCLTLSTLAIASMVTRAQTKTKSVDPSRLMSISFGDTSWNTDSKKIDSAFLVMRDKDTGKIVQIQLEETEPDSSQFIGQFSVNMGPNEKISPEIFVPPKDVRTGDRDNRKLYEMINNGKLVRKPVIWKKNEKGQAMIDVYDTREQAEMAMKAYSQEQTLVQDQKEKLLAKPVASESTLAAAAAAEKIATLKKLAVESAKRETDRVRLEQIEKQKAEDRMKAEKAATEKERTERRLRAAELNAQAQAFYDRGEFTEAEPLYKQIVDLDPSNTGYYFKYGVTLYRLGKFNDALVTLKLAKLEGQADMERHYFMALTHYRLGEIDSALKEFSLVEAAKDPVTGPASTFYIGVINFALEKYEISKKAFETVIDTSQDPRMDEQAEEYIERIANALAFKKMREKKFTVTGIAGVLYDSNVLLAPDVPSDQGTSTEIADVRFLTVADVEHRTIYTERHEWSPHLNASLTNSSKDSAASADPFLYNLSAPYSYKGMLFGKGMKLTAKPAYELLWMAPSASASSKENILNSIYLSVDTIFVMSPKYFASYGVEYRMDDSKLASSTGLNDSDAKKITIRTSHSVFLDKARKEALVANLGYVMNKATGENKTYNRLEGGVVYVRPIKWESSMSLGLSMYSLKYPAAGAARTDFNSVLSVGASKPIREWMTWGVIGSYTKNNSTDSSTYEYSKFLIMTTATFTTNF